MNSDSMRPHPFLEKPNYQIGQEITVKGKIREVIQTEDGLEFTVKFESYLSIVRIKESEVVCK